MDHIVCKYCNKCLDGQICFRRTDKDEWNCEPCEIVCRIAVDMISSGIHKIGPAE